MIRSIDHIGIAVRSLEESLPFWADALGMTVAGMETVKEEQVKVAFLTVGASRIELLEATAADSAIARSIEKRGPGVHHVTLEVTDLEATLTRLRSRGVSILARTWASSGAVIVILKLLWPDWLIACRQIVRGIRRAR